MEDQQIKVTIQKDQDPPIEIDISIEDDTMQITGNMGRGVSMKEFSWEGFIAITVVNKLKALAQYPEPKTTHS